MRADMENMYTTVEDKVATVFFIGMFANWGATNVLNKGFPCLI